MFHLRMRVALALTCLLALAAPGVAAGSDPSGERAALSAEQYYMSYGPPQALAEDPPAAAVAQDSQGSTSVSLIAVMLVVAAGLGVIAGRISTRRTWLHIRRAPGASTP